MWIGDFWALLWLSGKQRGSAASTAKESDNVMITGDNRLSNSFIAIKNSNKNTPKPNTISVPQHF